MSAIETKLVLKPLNIAVWTIILTGVCATLIIGRELLIPIVLSVFLAILLSSFREAIRRLPMFGQKLNGTFATVIAITIVLEMTFFTTSLLTSQAELMTEYSPIYESNFEKMAVSLYEELGLKPESSFGALIDHLDIGLLIGWIGEALSGVFSNLILTVMFTLFLLSEEKKFPIKLSRLMGDPKKMHELEQVSHSITSSIQTYVTSKTILSAATSIATYAILEVFNTHLSPLWGVLAFLLNFIPNVGSLIAVLLPCLFALLQFGDLTLVMILAASLGTVQFFIGNVIEPAYLGRQLNLSPFLVLVSLTLWGAIWGLVGMFLAVPLMVLTSLICQHIQGLEWISRLLSSDGSFMSIKARGV
ncbi:AI-2E family transporter [uncultured Vibrio sp.]|uniref:AI-2E family transporter n=1 Tax=uncultured Vibrio sp. TaxID=114054 RepID=UPI0025E0A604|nr:AI-2E family transporter [uncultured Vibrio sp.]